jgi:protein tyrosine phosphatase (PTP) superfamily phosphohydrolase (DUF442 family)
MAGYGIVAFGVFWAIMIAAAIMTPARESNCGNRARFTLAARSAAPERIDDSELHNLVDLGISVFSGAAPEGDAGFARLKALGISTIVSVDGAAPDVERARELGMRYVHLPIFYSGVPADKNLLLSKAIRDLPKPIYIHCHHGKHRGPAATAAALVSLGRMDNPSARRFLEMCGTSPSYAGLYRDVEAAKPISADELDAVADVWPERASVGGTVQAMTEIDQALARIEKIEAAKWTVPADHPDLVPHAEAALIAEHFRELARLPASLEKPDDFLKGLRESEDAAWCLEKQLSAAEPDVDRVKRCFDALKSNCKSCHKAYRDNLSGFD